jgi:hypothetical protein
MLNRILQPRDSQHPDREANHQIYVETWLTEEEYQDAKSKQLLAWQEPPLRSPEAPEKLSLNISVCFFHVSICERIDSHFFNSRTRYHSRHVPLGRICYGQPRQIRLPPRCRLAWTDLQTLARTKVIAIRLLQVLVCRSTHSPRLRSPRRSELHLPRALIAWFRVSVDHPGCLIVPMAARGCHIRCSPNGRSKNWKLKR